MAVGTVQFSERVALVPMPDVRWGGYLEQLLENVVENIPCSV